MNSTFPNAVSVISSVAKQSRGTCSSVALVCFVAALLAMTASVVFMGSGLRPAACPGKTGVSQIS